MTMACNSGHLLETASECKGLDQDVLLSETIVDSYKFLPLGVCSHQTAPGGYSQEMTNFCTGPVGIVDQ